MPVSHPVYPFSALVGQERLKRALILNAINPRIGGVLIRGEKGTAKSTAVRGLARLLPPISVVENSPYNCSPDQPIPLCPVCHAAQDANQPLPTVITSTPLVELPVSASEDRVVGSLDLEHAITEGKRRFEPGLLARAHRGLLYVDEVNLLDDHLVDLLLDAAAMGVNTVEREGISVSHPSRFILVGTMNPEEGELRPQLLDRFGLAVEIHGLQDPNDRIAVIERRLAYEADPDGFTAQWHEDEQHLASRISAACDLLPHVQIDKASMQTVAHLSLDLEVDGHRADLTILETARTHAAWEERQSITQEDIQLAAELAVPHRMRRQPFTEVSIGRERIEAALARSSEVVQAAVHGNNTEKKKGTVSDEPTLDIDPNAEWDGSQAVVGDTSDTGASRQEPPNERGKGIPLVEELFHPRLVEGLHADHKQRRAAGRRSHSRTTRKQGRYITSRNIPHVTDLAFDATVRAAAPYQRARRNALNQHGNDPNNMRSAARPTLLLHRHDMRQKVRTRRTRNAVCFVVDASWSMAAEQRMAVTRMAILSLLRDAYQRRDYVGLVSFQRSYATVLLPLTNSVELAQASLQTMPIGGKTPLSRGLLTGYEMLEHARRQDEEIIPLLVVITDGQANVAMGNKPPHVEAYEIAAFIAKQHIRSVVIDTDPSGGESIQGFSGITSAHITRADVGVLSYDGGLASDLATYLQGEYYQLDDLDAHRITDIARKAQLS